MVFLNILKIIGFVLLGIIGLILLILLIVLLWPFQYKIEGEYHDKFRAKAVISFLFRLVRVIFTFEDGKPLLVAKVLWIKVYENDFSGEDYPEEEDLFTPDIEDSGKTEVSGEDSSGSGVSEEEEPVIEELTDEEITEFMEAPEPLQSPKSVVDEFFDNIEKIIQKVKDKWYNFIRDLRKFNRKVRYYRKLVNYYWRVLHHKSMEPAMKKIKKTLIGILKHVRPRKARLYIHYGASNPADTANAVAIYSMIYPYYRKQIRLDAEFNESIIEGDGYIKGYFEIGVLGFYAVRAYLNKHVRKMIRLLLREGKKHG